MSEKRGIVEYFGTDFATSECGYCKGQKAPDADSSMWSHYLTADNYQRLIDRGWRRSGKYCYKPDLKRSCCPPYTIRCDTGSFQLSKSQRKILNAMYRFLAFGEKSKVSTKGRQPSRTENETVPQLPEKVIPETMQYSTVNCDKVSDTLSPSVAPMPEVPKTPVKPVEGDCMKRNKTKQIRFERAVQKLVNVKKCSREDAVLMLKQKRDARILQHRRKTLDERINRTLPENAAHKLEIRYSSTMGDNFDSFNVSHKMYQRYQMSVHQDTPDECTPKQFKRFLVDNPFEPEQFERINDDNTDATSLPTMYGAYHMQYWLDGELIAVGVIDILPNCLSSVYFFYDPKYEFLSLGTYSALREIDLTQKLNNHLPALRYYYMGFYIHSCVKMCYKRKYKPSYLLCPEALTWNPIERCLPLLDANKYQRLELNLTKIDEDGANIADEDILILFRRNAMRYPVYKGMSRKKDESEVKEYAKLVGKHCVECMLLYRTDN